MTPIARNTEQHENAKECQVNVQEVMTATHEVDKKGENNKTEEVGSDNETQASTVGSRPSWIDEHTSEIQSNPPKTANSQTSTTNTRPSWMDEDTSEIQPNPPKAVSRKTSIIQTRPPWISETTSEIQPNLPIVVNSQKGIANTHPSSMDEDTSEIQPNVPITVNGVQVSETNMGTTGKQRAKLDLLKKPKVLIVKTIDNILGNMLRMAIGWFTKIFPARE